MKALHALSQKPLGESRQPLLQKRILDVIGSEKLQARCRKNSGDITFHLGRLLGNVLAHLTQRTGEGVGGVRGEEVVVRRDRFPPRDEEPRGGQFRQGAVVPPRTNPPNPKLLGPPPHLPLRPARLREIGLQMRLLRPRPQIVCLQEVWVSSDYEAIREATRDVLPHGKLYRNGALGAGLAILSCWPFEESGMVGFALNGRPTAFWRGDWGGDVIHVFNTHTSTWIPLPPPPHHHLPLPIHDLWRVIHPDSALGPAEALADGSVPSARFNLDVNGATSDGPYNTWRWTKNAQNSLRAGRRPPPPVDPDAPDPKGKRLDYIFASVGPDSSWAVKSVAVTMTDPHPELSVSLSDHFAVSATLRRRSPTDDDDDESDQAHDEDETSLPLSAYDEILAHIDTYTARERAQRRYRALHFYAALVVWATILVVAWFAPQRFAPFLLALVASLVLAAGLIDGLLSLLFFSSELRSLQEFAWEVANARCVAASRSKLSP
ncbi:putative sphingomyelinase family protein [Ophiocordyceps camponoti-floridani]|uniref:Putative sphingomyelinase family protein n=1 Tax=Ophiocordyceps camponoti-floridani TaxID=2030778 RepID=A0A8H4Q121_9HYPO|nr:putative sphingomyelinase family protein [Ophiocordyceps camponoti-floridani]